VQVRSLTLVGAMALAAATMLPVATPALAQGQPPAAQVAPPPAARPLPPSRIEGRLAFLKTELKITDAQQKQWETLADTMRQLDKARRARFEQIRAQRPQPPAPGAAPPARPSALDQLQRRQTMAEQRAQDLKQFVVAFQPLYASLSDDQKKTADELFGRGRGEHGRHAMHGPRGRF
jgi:protein CpxP